VPLPTSLVVKNGSKIDLGDRVRGVDDQVQHHLIDLARHALDVGKRGVQIEFQLGDEPPLAARDRHRALDRLVQVDEHPVRGARVRELLHRAHDLGDALDPVDRLRERERNLVARVLEIDLASQGLRLLDLPGIDRFAAREPRDDRLLGVDHAQHIGDRVLHEQQIVAHEPRRRIDLVRDARRELADRLHLLRVRRALLQRENPRAHLQPGPELVGIERLHQVVRSSGLERRREVCLGAVRGEDDRVDDPGQLLELAADLDPGEPRHLPVEHRELDPVLADHLERRRAIAGGEDREVERADDVEREPELCRIIVRQEQSACHFGRPR
jgi:hypothetical protein